MPNSSGLNLPYPLQIVLLSLATWSSRCFLKRYKIPMTSGAFLLASSPSQMAHCPPPPLPAHRQQVFLLAFNSISNNQFQIPHASEGLKLTILIQHNFCNQSFGYISTKTPLCLTKTVKIYGGLRNNGKSDNQV